MARINIENRSTGETGFQVPGAALAPGWTSIGSSTPTVMSNANIIEKKIPEIQSKANSLLGSYPTTQVQEGQDMESPYQPLLDYTNGNDGSKDEILDLYDEMSSKSDANTKALLEASAQQYKSLQGRLAKAQDSNTAAVTGALRNVGSRYSPVSSAAFMQEKIANDLNEVADLQARENMAKQEIIAAGEEKDYRLMEKKVDLLEDRRKEKRALMTSILEDQVEANKAARAQAMQATRDTAVADLINQGVKDPAQMLEYLNVDNNGKQVGDFTAKEIGDAISNLIATKTYPGGMIGEYQFYADLERQNGRVPVDFNTYQNMDANRKISIARAGIDGTQLNDKDRAIFNQIVGKYNSSPAIQALDRANQLKNIVNDVELHPENAASQLNLIYAYIKGLDTDSAVREGEIDLVKSVQSITEKYKTEFQRLSEGKAISKEAALQIAGASKTLIKSIEDTAKRKQATFSAQAKANGTNVYGAWNGFSEGLKEYGSVSEGLVGNAKQTVDDFITANPDRADLIANMYDVPDTTDEEIVEYLRLNELIQ